MPNDERPHLRVEGNDDRHAIAHLLAQHRVDLSAVNIKDSDPGDVGTSGKDSLLAGMRTAVVTSTGTSVGFVLDADAAPTDRWRAVRTRLSGVGLEFPDEIPEGGFVGDAIGVRARVGVWLMPDNRRSGDLEKFLTDLVGREDPLLELATTSTRTAKEQGACFPEPKTRKAVLHTWLAWQERPGVPYGTAIKAHYLSPDSAAAHAFVAWFRRVFETAET